jgi:hypothetical protein
VADNSVVIQMSAADADLVAAWQRARQGPAALEKELERVGKTGKRAGKDVQGGMSAAQGGIGAVVKSVGGMIAGLASATTVARLFRQELDAIRQRNEAALGQSVSLATAQAKAHDAARGAGLSAADLETAASGTSLLQADFYSAATSGLKAAGKGRGRLALDTIKAGESLTTFLPQQERDELIGAAVDLQKQAPGIGNAEAIAQVLSVSRRSESSAGEVAKSFGPMIGRASKLAQGATPGDLAAIALAVEATQDSGFGAASDTVEKLLTELSKQKVTGTLDQQLARAGKDHGLQNRLLARFRDPGQRLAVQELLSGGQAAQEFTRLRGEVGGAPADVLRREEAAARQSAALMPAANIERGTEVEKQKLNRDTHRTLAGVRSKIINDLVHFGASPNVAAAESLWNDATHDAITPADAVRSIEQRVERQRTYAGGRKTGIGFLSQTGLNLATGRGFDPTRAATRDELVSAEALGRLEKLLEQQLAIMEREEGKPVDVRLPADTRPQRPAAAALNQ